MLFLVGVPFYQSTCSYVQVMVYRRFNTLSLIFVQNLTLIIIFFILGIQFQAAKLSHIYLYIHNLNSLTCR